MAQNNKCMAYDCHHKNGLYGKIPTQKESERLDLPQDYLSLCRILPLHSRITTQEQASVFKKPPEGFRKVCKAKYTKAHIKC